MVSQMDLGATSISLNSPHVCIVDLRLGQPHDLQRGPRRIDVGMQVTRWVVGMSWWGSGGVVILVSFRFRWDKVETKSFRNVVTVFGAPDSGVR